MHTIRDYRTSDCAAVLAIYNDAICHSSATFEEQPLSLPVFAERLATIAAEFPLLVIEQDGKVAGYAYGNHYKPRSAYRFCCETTIYMAPHAQGRGLGQPLYHQLIERLKAQGIEQLLAIVTHPNEASARFHQQMGFERVGLMTRVGFKFERWYDVAIYQRSLVPQLG
ncbi:GNAT family N-acetyltransferase [Ferrimonas senticii]|uniref:GNAT family N-acetyltransferase n=1 Tax=Ferrimonas senticii TaxID=394566 RepID=UPI00040A9E19|nr:GNAT family N-acetyltransferase [Ferrimonas senticii]